MIVKMLQLHYVWHYDNMVFKMWLNNKACQGAYIAYILHIRAEQCQLNIYNIAKG